MNSFDHCPAERLRPIVGVLTDIDDTLTRGGEIEAEALAALRRLDAAGVPVVAVTGRPAGWSEPFAMRWPVRGIAAENGGVLLLRSGDRLLREFSADEATRAARAERLAACAAAVRVARPDAQFARDSTGRLTDIAIDHGEFATLDAAGIDTVLRVMQAHGLRATVSSIHVNGWIGDHDKWSAACWAVPRCTAMPFDADRWICVGDSANDGPMFERMKMSVGVANGRAVLERLPVPPAWITSRERGAGFAQVADALLRAR